MILHTLYFFNTKTIAISYFFFMLSYDFNFDGFFFQIYQLINYSLTSSTFFKFESSQFYQKVSIIGKPIAIWTTRPLIKYMYGAEQVEIGCPISI